MKIKIAQVIGLNTDQKAAQVYSSIQDSENAFFALLILECDDAFTKGRQTLSEISSFYFDEEGTPHQKLTASFLEMSQKLKDSYFDFILASLSGKVLYLLGKGQVSVYLKRNGKISQLLSVGAPSDLISGFLQPEDRILFATKNLTSYLGEDLTKALDLNIDEFEEDISNRVSSGGLEEDGLSGLLVEIEDEKQVAIPSLEERDEDLAESQDLSGDYRQKFKIKDLFIFIIKKALGLKNFIPKSDRGRLIIGFILILIILTGVGFQFKSNKEKGENEQFNQALQNARADFEGAKGLSSLNPAESRTKLDSAKDNLNKALNLKPKDSQALDLKNQIEKELPSILQQITVSEFPLFLDLELIKKGFSAQKITLSGSKILLLDPNTKTLVTIDINKKSNQILSGESQLGKGKDASINGELAFVYSEDKGVLKIDSTNQKVTSVAKFDNEWGKITDIIGFGSNVYLLDSLKGQIWKYLPTTDGYSDKREYLNKGVKVDFAGSVRMQIESSVYVLKSTGEIFRFTRGDKDHFGLEGLDKGIKDPKSFFVSSDTDNLYLLDSGNKRLLVLTKTGAYKGQYQGDKFAQVSDLVVDEEGKKVYLLEGSKIYSVDLK